MKKIYELVGLFSFVFLVSLFCFSDKGTEELRLSVIEENIRTENVIKKYNKTIEEINSFNTLFEVSLKETIKEDLNKYGFIVSPYIENTREKINTNVEVYNQTVSEDVLIETVYEEMQVEFIPLFVSETGAIEEYISINSSCVDIKLVIYWDNGEIRDIQFV